MKFHKKIICVLTFFTITLNVFSQFTAKEKKQLNSLEIDVSKLDLKDIIINNNLKLILEKDNARKSNKTTAIVLTSISLLSITAGAIVFDNYSTKLSGIIGGSGLVGAGLISGGISIPFWIYTEKRRKQRNKLIYNF